MANEKKTTARAVTDAVEIDGVNNSEIERGKSKKKSVILRDFFSLGTRQEEKDEPSPLVSDYIVSVGEMKTLCDYLKEFNFKSEKEIKEAISLLIQAVRLDPYLSNSKNRAGNVLNDAAFELAKMYRPDKLQKFINSNASDVWLSFHAPRIRDKKHKDMFPPNPDREKFQEASERLMEVWNLDYEDIYRLRLFSIQLRERDSYPASDIRILYLYGNLKWSGKTTVAKKIVAIGNGDLVFRPEYETNLSNELGVARFGKLGIPAIAVYNCALIDEAFYKDMGKTYADFKALVTTTGGIYRLPYGQPIPWSGRANYVFTSNDPLQTFIKDWDDRRFLPIEFKKKPEQLDEYDLTVVLKDFITNATVPEGKTLKEFIELVASFSDVEGERSLEMKNLVGVISGSAFLAELRSKGYELFIPTIKSIVQTIEPSYKIAKTNDDIYRAAMRKLFGEPDKNRSSWNKKHLEEVLEALEAKRIAEGESDPF